MTTKLSRILGVGQGLPKKCLTNDALIKKYQLDSSHEWIQSRTGITQRYICEEENVSSLALLAAEQALKNANFSAKEIDLIIVATCTPDSSFPSTAMKVQQGLGCKNIPAFDLNAACSGFIYALHTADSLMKNGQGTTALVIGAECFSRILDWQDRTTSILFGDGAGAAVIRQEESNQGILGAFIDGDGSGVDSLYASTTVGPVHMNGRDVFKYAVRAMGDIDEEWLKQYGIQKGDIDWVVPHQANVRILDAAAELAKIPHEKVVKTVQQHANTSAASIPLALSAAVEDGRLKQGDLVLLQAFGAGFTWGQMLIRW